ncbi:MAG: fumarate hydratase [Clostridia bacterium]|nr:fumarate hydratase [Clostridia bacterium]
MRTIEAIVITNTVKKLCVEANCYLGDDIKNRLTNAAANESWQQAKEILGHIIDNYQIAEQKGQPICQDTGVACVFLKIGQDVHVQGDITEAVNQGVRDGYRDGYLRKSVVADPLNRTNTGDNTPAMIYFDVVPGDQIEITVAPKGFGSENMSKIAMLRPSDGLEGVKEFVKQTVLAAGPNPCPPIVVGVGIGGTFDKAAYLAKKALLRPVDQPNGMPFYAQLEKELLEEINALGIGPQGFGGKTTALAVNIEHFPTHIAGLPVAVNINCHVTRHKTEVI